MTRIVMMLAVLIWSGASFATPWVFYSKPAYQGYRLDWCKNWAADCGRPAVDAYCSSKGYKGSQYFSIDENIGLTRLITGPVCDGSYCDGFRYLYCRKANETYVRPTYLNDRVDWCLNFASDCGKPAADRFCENRGWNESYAYAIDPDIGRTRLLTGAVCEGSYCDGFAYIRCRD